MIHLFLRWIHLSIDILLSIGLLFAARVKPWMAEIHRPRFVLDGMRSCFSLVVLKCIFVFKSIRTRMGLVEQQRIFSRTGDIRVRTGGAPWKVYSLCVICGGYCFFVEMSGYLLLFWAVYRKQSKGGWAYYVIVVLRSVLFCEYLFPRGKNGTLKSFGKWSKGFRSWKGFGCSCRQWQNYGGFFLNWVLVIIS